MQRQRKPIPGFSGDTLKGGQGKREIKPVESGDVLGDIDSMFAELTEAEDAAKSAEAEEVEEQIKAEEERIIKACCSCGRRYSACVMEQVKAKEPDEGEIDKKLRKAAKRNLGIK